MLIALIQKLKKVGIELRKVVVRRADIFMANLPDNEAEILRGQHPVLILSNYVSNKFSNLVSYVPLTSTIGDNPSNVFIGTEYGLKHESMVLTNQVMTMSKDRILFKIGFANPEKMQEIETVLIKQLGIKNNWGNLKLFQLYEHSRNSIRLAKCQENWILLEELTKKYLKNLHEIDAITQGSEISTEMEWAYFHLSLIKKKNGEVGEAYNLVRKGLNFSVQKDSEYYYSMWLLGSICMELKGKKYRLEGLNAFEECIEYYHSIGDKKYEILLKFNKAAILKNIQEMEKYIEVYNSTKFKPVLYYFGDMERDDILEQMKEQLKNVL